MRVLVADDDAVSRRLLERTLRVWGYDVVIAADGTRAWSMLDAEDGPRLAILDWMMPGVDGPEICRRVRRLQGARYVHCLLLTAKDRRDDVVTGLEAGADDFLVKPFDPLELKARLRTAERVLGLEEALRVQATYDALTGALNRTAVLDLLRRELSRGARARHPVTAMMLDLDHFKAVNDTRGHMAGDAVLREVVRRTAACVRAYDGVGRYGGEEFLIVLPGCGAEEALRLAERIRASVTATGIDTPEGRVSTTASIGLAWSVPAETTSPEDLIGAADRALYAAKERGRNRVERAGLGAAAVASEPGLDRGGLAAPRAAQSAAPSACRPSSDSTVSGSTGRENR